MALFEQLPEDVNLLICRFVLASDLDLEQLGRLRCVSKAWKQAVEEGALGNAGSFHRAGLPKFVCRVTSSARKTYPGLGILNEDGTVLHIHPCISGAFGKGWTGLGERHIDEVWIDIPESTVVVGHTIYVLGEPKLPDGSLEKVKKMRLRSYDLTAGNGWHERASLHFKQEEAPYSPASECSIDASWDTEHAEQTTFNVVASGRYIFVLHLFDSARNRRNLSNSKVKSARGSLYDTGNDIWRSLPLPSQISSQLDNLVLRGVLLSRNLFSFASAKFIYIISEWGIFVHTSEADKLEQPWDTISIVNKTGKRIRYKAF